MKEKKILKSLKKTSGKAKKTTRKKVRKKISTKASTKKRVTASKKPLVKPQLPDIAHSPGHRRLNKLDKFTEPKGPKVQLQEAAINNLSNSDIIKKHNSRHRRIINGAAIGKTGRIIIKE